MSCGARRRFLGLRTLAELHAVRLLHHIAQSCEPFLVREDDGELWQLAEAAEFAQRVVGCPLRYVLSDELVRTCTALAYSDGDELSGVWICCTFRPRPSGSSGTRGQTHGARPPPA